MNTTKIGVAGVGALGSIVVRALLDGLPGYELAGVSDVNKPPFDVKLMDFAGLAEACDLVVECLPPKIAPEIAKEVLTRGKTLMLISSSALLLFPDIREWAKQGGGRILVPSGALAGLDAVAALAYGGIDEAVIASTKPPQGFKNAPYVVENKIDLDGIRERVMIFRGTALEAAKAFPANVNVAASLSLAGIGADNTAVEVWADPAAKGNSHQITVRGGSSTITARVDNVPDPSNPKSSMLAGYSIVSCLKKLKNQVVTL